GEEDAVPGANYGAVVNRVRQVDARREILAPLRDASCLWVVRIGDGGLRQPGFFVAQAVAESDLPRNLPGVLHIEIDIAGAQALDRVAEGLRESSVIVAARRGAGEILGEVLDVAVRVSAVTVEELVGPVLGGLEIHSEF